MNLRIIRIVSEIFLALTPLAAAAETVAYYRFDGTIGNPVTTITDSGPASLDGTSKGLTRYSAGVLGTGLDLSGDGNYGSIPHSPRLVLTNDFTVELFMKASQPYNIFGSDPADVINKLLTADVGIGLSSFAIEYASNGSLVAFVGYGLDLRLLAGPTPPSFSDGRWHHVALVFHYNSPVATNRLELFVDYTLQSTASGKAAPVAWVNFPIYLGAGNYPNGQDNSPFRRNFDGSIDEVRISNVALTPQEFVTIPPTRFARVAIADSLGGIQLRWDSRDNHAYQVQFTPELPAGIWTKLSGALPGNGNPLTLTDAFDPGQLQRFFRVLESP